MGQLNSQELEKEPSVKHSYFNIVTCRELFSGQVQAFHPS